ncbi:MAG TPA: dipeptide epimerase [Bacteroidia bacterium]|nr:dipeptide epimerase [Bacteroidia bacterium]HNT79299.1 dipeptide epimerase [Bacteroidia bacterium]
MGLKLSYSLYDLSFKHPFRIAHVTRSHTPSVFIKLEYENHCGYGEATLPPYVEEGRESVVLFLNKLVLPKQIDLSHPFSFLLYLHSIEGNYFAKAAIDMAFHDLWGKLMDRPVYELFDLDQNNTPLCTYTLGMGNESELIEKLNDADKFDVIKVKLGGTNDREMIACIQKHSNKSICVDVNQGWKDKEQAIEMMEWLALKKILFVEQPLPKENWEDMIWLKERSALPLYADESVQGMSDLKKCSKVFDGVNIKLMKCGGLFKAKQMIEFANQNKLSVLMGCMSESSCGVSAAAQLTPLCQWADLDGPLLINNDPFQGIEYGEKGKIKLKAENGIGVRIKDKGMFN